MGKRRRFSKKRQLKIYGWLTLGLAALFIIAVKTRDVALAEGEETYFPLKELNKEITNQMSDVPELEGLDKKIEKYIWSWHIKGASLAITRNDSLVYAKGYGWADQEKELKMEPGHIMRVASVSKLITAV